MHIERIDFDEVFDVQPGPGDFSFRSGGRSHFGVNLRRGLVPQAGSRYLVAFARPGDWTGVIGWVELRTGTVRLKESTWFAMLSDIGWFVWLAPFLAGGALWFFGAGAALAVLLVVCGLACLRLYRTAGHARQARQALSAAYAAAINEGSWPPAVGAGYRP